MGIRTIEVTLFCIKRYMLRHLIYNEYFGNGIMIKSIIMKVDGKKICAIKYMNSYSHV